MNSKDEEKNTGSELRDAYESIYSEVTKEPDVFESHWECYRLYYEVSYQSVVKYKPDFDLYVDIVLSQ